MFDVKPVTSERQTDCGPTCLKMLLEFYGINVELQQLIQECGVDIIGCSANDLTRVAREHGLTEITIYSMDAEELVKQDRPAIIWWCWNHFVVFCGKNDKGEIVICNPDRGRFPIDFGTFKTRMTGIKPGQGISIWNGEPHEITE